MADAPMAYCVKCRTKREMKDPVQVTMSNGRPATQGTCPECGTKLFRIGSGGAASAAVKADATDSSDSSSGSAGKADSAGKATQGDGADKPKSRARSSKTAKS